MRRWTFFLICGLLPAQVTVTDLLEEKTIEQVRAVGRSMEGVMGFAAIDLETGRITQLNGDVVFPQASSIKIPILIQMFRAARAGRFRFDDQVTLQPGEAVGGSGRLQLALKNGPVTLSVRELIGAMIQASDNTATNKCIEMVGMENVNRTLDELGLTKTRLRRKMMDGAAAARDEENVSTPIEMARLMELIYHGRVMDASASRGMLDFLKLVRDDMRRAVPQQIEVASKPGALEGVRCETGLILLPRRPFVLSVASAYLTGTENPVGPVTRILFHYFEKLARSNRYGRQLQ